MLKQSCDTIVTADIIVTQDAERSVINKGAIAICKDTIAAVGPAREVRNQYIAEQNIDMGKAMLMPGLVNAHTHVSMTILRGLADDLPLMEWLTQHIFPVEQKLTEDIVRLGALLGCAEMLRTGTTSFMDMYLLENGVCRAVDEIGMRAVASEAVFMFPSPAYPDFDAARSVLRTLHGKWKSHQRVSTAIGPHAVYTSNPEILVACRDMAQEFGCMLNIHLAETATETAQCKEMFGKRPVEYAHDLNLLGPNTLVNHCVDLLPDEITLLAESGVHISHNPKSNMKLASGISPVQALLDAGAVVGLGTDGAASNNALNMFSEMSTAALLGKVGTLDPTTLPAQTILDMATLNSAACIGLPDVGCLAPAKAADIIALDLQQPNMRPMHNPVSQCVYAASGHEVAMTMVGGQVLYQKGQYCTIDYDGLLDEIAALKDWMKAE